MNYVQDFVSSSCVCAHCLWTCCSATAAAPGFLQSSLGEKKPRDGSCCLPAGGSAGCVLFHGADVGVTPARWESWPSPPPSGSSDRLRDVMLFDRRPMFSWVKADPFGTSLLKGRWGEKKQLLSFFPLFLSTHSTLYVYLTYLIIIYLSPHPAKFF